MKCLNWPFAAVAAAVDWPLRADFGRSLLSSELDWRIAVRCLATETRLLNRHCSCTRSSPSGSISQWEIGA